MHKKLRRAKGEIALSIGTILMALFFMIEAERIRDGLRVMVSAKMFPRIYAGVMMFCAVLLLISAVREYRAVPQEIKQQDKMTAEQKRGLLRVFEVFIVLLLAAIFYKSVGFLIVTPIAMFLLFMILDKPENRNYILFGVLSIVCPLVMYVMFYALFSNLLPPGILRPIIYMFL